MCTSTIYNPYLLNGPYSVPQNYYLSAHKKRYVLRMNTIILVIPFVLWLNNNNNYLEYYDHMWSIDHCIVKWISLCANLICVLSISVKNLHVMNSCKFPHFSFDWSVLLEGFILFVNYYYLLIFVWMPSKSNTGVVVNDTC